MIGTGSMASIKSGSGGGGGGNRLVRFLVDFII